jgi:hypothetical protein
LHVRALTGTSDGKAILAAIHVGGIPRSTDGGTSWQPTVPVSFDVHEVKAHGAAPNILAAASGKGLCLSRDGGSHWDLSPTAEGPAYSLAVGLIGDEALFSIQEGPFARRSQIWRANLADSRVERVADGLPDWLEGKVDTAHIATDEKQAAILDRGGNLWLSRAGTRDWKKVASGLKETAGLVLLSGN